MTPPPTTISPTSAVISSQPTEESVPPYDVMTDFVPSGWMGDINSITLDTNAMTNPHSGESSIKIVYSPTGSKGWAGIYWQYPENNWGDQKGGIDLSNYSKVTFWARGENGGERAEFKVGGIGGKYSDSIQPAVSSGVITLSKDWQQYIINLNGKDLSHVIGGFVWVTNKESNPKGATIYIDDIQFE